MKAYQRLIKYSEFPTASDENCEKCPSTAEQLTFAKYLAEEMRQIGISDVSVDEHGYVMGIIPANTDCKCPAIGFIAHMDVVRDVEYKNIKTRVIENYDGKDIVLNREKNIVMSPDEYESLRQYQGKTLVVTDGTTLLGADDKAGVAEIMTAAARLCSDTSIPHGKICIGFTPDEEIGRGADLFDVGRFGADFAYTLDGAGFGEVEYETFCAASLTVDIKGVSIHPGSAKNKMINAITVANEFDSMLPSMCRPERTEGYQGFFHAISIQGTSDRTVLRYIIRDHDSTLLEKKKEYALRTAEEINRRYGREAVRCTIKDSYSNMKEKIMPHFHLIENAYEAVKRCGGTPQSLPVRGGTDGSRLSFMGLPCPNLGTGSHNHHGTFEYACAEDMERAVDMIVEICRIYC